MVKAILEKDYLRGSILLYLFSKDQRGTRKIARPTEIIFEEITGQPEYLEIRKYSPFMEFQCDNDSEDILKAIAKAFQEYGLLPTDDNPGELKATKFHLEDMRNIVFKKK